jgi:hypothetical protein
MSVGIWKISNNQPVRLSPSIINLEERLEDWIEQDPALVQEGLTIVGRQIIMPPGRLDLLGIDPFGRIVVIENKREGVRRETVAQALDYAAYLAERSANDLVNMMESYLSKHDSSLKNVMRRLNLDDDFLENPEFIIFVVGTGQDENLERMIKHIDFDVSVIELGVFQSEYGEYFITRQFTELDAPPDYESVAAAEEGQHTDIQRLFNLAHQNGIGEAYRIVYEAAIACGLYPRIHKTSIMYAPPANKTRCLMYAKVKPKNKQFNLYLENPAFAEFYPVKEKEVRRQLGWSEYKQLTVDDAKEFAENLRAMFAEIEKNSRED